MDLRKGIVSQNTLLVLFSLLVLALTSCDATKHLNSGEYLLRKNNLKLETDKGITERGELKDNIERLIAQKTNTYLVLDRLPYKVWLYNLRYKKYEKDTSNFQLKSKTVERPVVFDSTLVKRSVSNIRSYLFNQGYFYPQISDTVRYKGKKAYVDYIVKTGTNFLMNKITLDVDDSAIYTIVNRSMGESFLQGGREFSMSLLDNAFGLQPSGDGPERAAWLDQHDARRAQRSWGFIIMPGEPRQRGAKDDQHQQQG